MGLGGIWRLDDDGIAFVIGEAIGDDLDLIAPPEGSAGLHEPPGAVGCGARSVATAGRHCGGRVGQTRRAARLIRRATVASGLSTASCCKRKQGDGYA